MQATPSVVACMPCPPFLPTEWADKGKIQRAGKQRNLLPTVIPQTKILINSWAGQHGRSAKIQEQFRKRKLSFSDVSGYRSALSLNPICAHTGRCAIPVCPVAKATARAVGGWY